MEFAVLGWPPDGPTLRLDWRRFPYAGKFVMTNTGKAVAREPAGSSSPPIEDRDGGETSPDPAAFEADVLAAVAFNADRTDDATLWLRYVTVREDRRGEGIGPRLAAFVAARAARRGYDRVRIAVNNPFAYRAMYRAGFAYTGRGTGIAELVLERPAAQARAADAERDPGTYRDGLDRFRTRDLDRPAAERDYLADLEGSDPPPVVEVETSAEAADPGPAGETADTADETNETTDSGSGDATDAGSGDATDADDGPAPDGT